MFKTHVAFIERGIECTQQCLSDDDDGSQEKTPIKHLDWLPGF